MPFLPPHVRVLIGARLRRTGKHGIAVLLCLFLTQHLLGQDPCATITSLSCGGAVTATPSGAGIWNVTACGFSTPGQERVYSFTPGTTGVHTLQVNSVSGGYIDYFYKAASGGCSSSGWTCIDDINFTGTYPIGTLTAGVQYYILLDPEGTGSYSHNFQINCPVALDPCSNITTLACATPATVTLAGTGIWNSSTCFFSTPGQEKVYSFTPTTTGLHAIQVTSASGTGYIDYMYKAASGGCSASGWTCIDDINFTGTFTIGTLTAGVQYYILLDAESSTSSTQTFQINCPVAVDPCTSITTLTCASPASVTLSGSGVWNNSTCLFSTPGQEKVHSFTPTSTGLHTLQVTAASGTGYIDYMYKAASGGCSATGWTCIDDINFTGTFTIGTLTAGVQYYILLDAESTASSTQTFQINCPSAPDPCSGITTLPCATPATATLTGSGAWNMAGTYPTNSCGFSTLGQEKIYSFTPTTTGMHALQVTSSTGSYIDYFYKAASGGCGNTGWTCIDDISIVSTVTIGTLTAGVQYYFLLDAESTSSVTHTFQINCPTVPPCVANPTSPTNGQNVCLSAAQTLSWATATGATSYDVYFGTSTPPPFVANTSSTDYLASTPAAGTYYWQIRPKNAAGAATGCNIWNFMVMPLQSAAFSYAQNGFCQAGSDPAPTIYGTPGGIFSAPAQVSINSSNGTIDVSASTAGGPYTITYTTPGPCAAAATFNLSIVDCSPGAILTDMLVIDNPPAGFAQAGDRIKLTASISNAQAANYEGVQLTLNNDPRVTFVPGSFKSTPVAVDDAYSAALNTQLNVVAGSGVLQNDFDNNIPGLTVTAFSAMSAQGGMVMVNGNGSFTYNPPMGFTGNDTFTYTITDSDSQTDTGTVRIRVQ